MIRNSKILPSLTVVGIAAVLLCLVGLLSACAELDQLTESEAAPAKGVRIVKVTDGDTLKVRFRSGKEADVRLIGIDTPEVYYGEECGGRAASDNMKRLAEGKAAKLIADRTQDQVDGYGRLLRYVEVGGRDLGRAQILAGRAAPYVFDQPTLRTDRYRAAAAKAEAAGTGVWGECGGNFHSLDDEPWSGD